MVKEGSRRLAAVWFADIVGYSTLSARDEDAALALVEALQRAAAAEVPRQGGRVVKFVGDGALAVFESVDGALRAALALQTRFAASEAAHPHGSLLRIGLHLGEVTESADGDVYGDGVNVASRLQSKARPGTVVVSRAVKEMIRGRATYAVHKAPVWHHLKGMGVARVFEVASVDAPPPATRRPHSRAVAVGLTSALVAFGVLTLSVAMKDGGGEAARELSADELLDGTVRVNLGIEHYFAGELPEAVEALEAFVKPPLRFHPAAQRALRYLARAHLESERPDLARATLAQMVNAEPPMALLIPSAESDALLALYYDVRRGERMHRAEEAPGEAVGGVVVFDLEVVLDTADAVLAELGPSVSQMLVSELEEAGIPTRYFWALMLGFTGEGAYDRFEEEMRSGADARASHVLQGRAIVRGSQVTVSAQVYELATGALQADELETAAWPDGLFDVVERLGSALAAALTPAAAGG